MTTAVTQALRWLQTCITTPHFAWDPGQRAAAQEAHDAALAEAPNVSATVETVGNISIRTEYTSTASRESRSEAWGTVASALSAAAFGWHRAPGETGADKAAHTIRKLAADSEAWHSVWAACVGANPVWCNDITEGPVCAVKLIEHLSVHQHVTTIGPHILLTDEEVQSGLDRVTWAEGLIRQLPPDHDGRNTWLMRHGTK